MKVTQSVLPDGNVKLFAQASADELRGALDYAYGAFARAVGLALDPQQSVEEAALQKLGIVDLSSQIQPYLEERLVALAVDKSSIAPAFLPKTAALSEPKSRRGINLEFVVMPKPAFELSSYEPVSISVVRPVIFEEDIDREMAAYDSIMADFDDAAKHEKLRALVVQKLEDLNAQSFVNQKRQAVSIELAKRLEGEVPDGVLRMMFAERLDGLKAQLSAQGTSYSDFLDEHGGEENVNMLLMWQARETLRQGYALDALYRHEKLSVSQAEIDETCCIISGIGDLRKAREAAHAMGRLHVVKETAQRFKAADWAVERAEVSVRDQTPLDE